MYPSILPTPEFARLSIPNLFFHSKNLSLSNHARRRSVYEHKRIASTCSGVNEVKITDACSFDVIICQLPEGTFVANATSPSKSVARGKGFPDATSAEKDAIFRLLIIMDAIDAPNQRDCSCNASFIPVDQGKCTATYAICLYFPNASAIGVSGPLYRATAFNEIDPSSTSKSQGYTDLSQGCSNPVDCLFQAISGLQTACPAYQKECPTIPIVMVPGYPSTSIEYKLSDAPPPPGHNLCPQSTADWEPLYPPDPQALLQPACYTANLGVPFNNTTKLFADRQGEQTRFLPGFAGIPPFAGVVEYFGLAGWVKDQNFAAAPFDWRLPSCAQKELFASWKALIEKMSGTNNNSKVGYYVRVLLLVHVLFLIIMHNCIVSRILTVIMLYCDRR